MPDGQIFDIITNGFGLMPAYRYPVPVADRWAIIVHLRALQTRRLERTGGAATAAEPATAAAPAEGAPTELAPDEQTPDEQPDAPAPTPQAPTEQVTQ